MDNTKTIIRSSILSILIVAIGLFMLCISRAPSINTEETAFGGGDGANSEYADDEEQALLNLLNEAEDDLGLNDLEETGSQEYQQDQVTQADPETDDALAALLNDGQNTFSGSEAQNDDASMDELMSLLQAEDDQLKEQSTDPELFQELNSSQEFSMNDYEESPAESQATQTGTDDANAVASLNDEISYLQNVLTEKNSEKNRLLFELQDYDNRIAQMEARLASPGSSDYPGNSGNYTASLPAISEQNEASISNSFSNVSGDDFEIVYQDALQLFLNHSYNAAEQQFYQLLQINSRHKLTDNCQYWLGECYYAQGKYYQALAEFTKVSAFDATDKKDDAQLMMGLCFLKLGSRKNAETELSWLVSAYASSEYVNKAYRYLNQL